MSGATVPCREQYFTFDAEVYRAWGGGASVWLDDDPDDGSSAADVQHKYSNCCQQEIVRNEEYSGKGGQDPDRDRSMYVPVQQNERTESMGEEAPDDDRGASVFHTAVHEQRNPPHRGERSDSGSNVAALIGSTCCTYAANAAHINPADYIALPVEKDEPCHVCGRRPTSSVKRGGGLYLCYDCLKRAKRPAKVQPLPGVLDHRTFGRTKVELGRCDVCAEKKAVYRSREAQANICETCYARLVREWNGREGIR